jgi:membrane protein DedA with SNARE-associated domain/pimeloyl-ACP methyl ester carboxylesterase
MTAELLQSTAALERGAAAGRRRLRTWLIRLGLIYLLALGASHAWRALHTQRASSEAELAERGLALVWLDEVANEEPTGRPIRLAYSDSGPREAPVLLLVHGSPGDRRSMEGLERELGGRYRTLVVDLPGFGASERRLGDYSFRAHALYLEQFLARLGIQRVHLVGFSQGGGVVLELDHLLGPRCLSVSLVSAIGAIEVELLGNLTLNRGIHGLQLAALWIMIEGLPHFGALDGSIFGIEYARNFYDSDQGPLRGYLERFDKPLLIVHGRRDELVPYSAAVEHARIVPQAVFDSFDTGHFLIFLQPAVVAQSLTRFIETVEDGQAQRRTDASPEERLLAEQPFDPRSASYHGLGLLVVMVLIALATLVSEDLTCIAAGAMVAQGRLGLVPAATAAFLGILVGDLLLYLAGRLLGPSAVRSPPLSWMLSEAQVHRAARWFERRGLTAIFATRFMPGMRLPTYLAAGALRANALRFTLYFAIAALVWTPLLVWGSSLLGGELKRNVAVLGEALPLFLLATVALGLVVVKVLVPACTWRGRRLLWGSLRRKLAWEFWPAWLVYPPTVVYLLWQGLRRGSLTLFCAANPGMEGGGFVDESKLEILTGLGSGGGRVPAFRAIPAGHGPEQRGQALTQAIAELGGLPLVIKPDAGQRGSGVLIARDLAPAEEYVRETSLALVVQAYVPGLEYGVYYARHPQEIRGRVLGVTLKRMPSVVGDGRRSLEQLILADPRAVALAELYFRRNELRLDEVIPAGERVQLSELGTHARGCIFLDGSHLITPALEQAIDEVAQGLAGFHLGRFDLRAPSDEALAAGDGIQVLEVNGVTSEPTHMYDPRHSFLYGQRELLAHWRRALEFGAANRARGVAVPGVFELLARWGRYRQRQKAHRGG